MQPAPDSRASYLESLDPTRFVPTLSAEERLERLVHLRLEILLSLLLGQKVFIPEPYSFDSLGFAGIATEVIESRDRLIEKNLQARLLLKRTPVFMPFQLKLVSTQPSPHAYVDVVSTRVANPNFILSSVPELTVIPGDAKMEATRLHLAEAIRREGFEALRNHLPADRADFPDYLALLAKYFSSEQLPGALPLGTTRSPFPTLEHYTQWLRGADGLNGLPTSLHESAIILIQAFSKLERAKIPITDRSRIRLYGKSHAGLDDRMYELAVEFVDSCYNRVLGSALDADFKSHNTGGRVSNPAVREAELISKLGHAFLTNSHPSWENMDLLISPSAELVEKFVEVSGGTNSTSGLVDLENWKSWTAIWDRMWNTIASPEWMERLRRLQAALSVREGDDRLSEADEALDALISVIAKELRPIQIERKGVSTVRLIALAMPLTKLAVYLAAIPMRPSGATKDAFDVAKSVFEAVRARREFPQYVFSRGSIERSLRLG